VFQVLKLYQFSKIEIDKFVQTPAVSEALGRVQQATDETLFTEIHRPPKSLAASNVFTSAESLLLKWVTIHYCADHTGSCEIINDFLQLQNPKYFLGLLRNHLPRAQIAEVTIPKTPEDLQQNVQSALTTIQSVRTPFTPTEADLTKGDRIVLAIVVLQLLETLPHFIPSTEIIFTVPLSERSVQQISVTNPSRSELVYVATLEGSANFRTLESRIVLGPSQTVDVSVEYFARTHNVEQAVLSLVPEKSKVAEPKGEKPASAPNRRSLQRRSAEPPVFASTIVLTMKSDITTNGPLRVIEIEGPIYATTKQTLKIPNAVQLPGKYTVIPRYIDLAADGKNMPALIRNLLNDPRTERSYPPMPTLYASMLHKHQHFLVVQKKITFEAEDSSEKIDIEFIPISLGEFHCLLLFYSARIGEFVYHLIGRATLPQPQVYGLNLKAEAGLSHTAYITVVQRTDCSRRRLGIRSPGSQQ
jgi:hypothetical protein